VAVAVVVQAAAFAVPEAAGQNCRKMAVLLDVLAAQ